MNAMYSSGNPWGQCNDERSNSAESGSRSPLKSFIFQNDHTNCVRKRPRGFVDGASVGGECGSFVLGEKLDKGNGRLLIAGKSKSGYRQRDINQTLRNS